MMLLRRSYGVPGWTGCLVCAALAVSVLGESAAARDRYIVQRDGQKVRLVKSDIEFVVTIQDSAEVDKVAKRLAGSADATLADVPWAPRARVKLLRVNDTSTARRRSIAQDQLIKTVHPVYRLADGGDALLSTGTINVRLQPGLTAAERTRIWSDYRVRIVAPVKGLNDTYVVRPVADDQDEVLRAEAMALDRRTRWAQPNFRTPTRLRQNTPADPYFGQQWHLENTGQFGGTTDADIDAQAAWLVSEGQDVLIGMFDDACDVDHEDLVDNYIGEGHDPSLASTAAGFSDPRPKQIGDLHGTAVMGLAVARANALGVRGVAYLARFTASRGLGEALTDAEMASVYTFARQQEVDVHINSWGLAFNALVPAILEDAIETAFSGGRDLDGDEGEERPRGMVVLFASGNGVNGEGGGVEVTAGREVATLPTVIGVGASNDEDRVASYSDFGPEIDVLAPGGGDNAGITTLDNTDSFGYVEGGLNIGGVYVPGGIADLDEAGKYTQNFAGTSAACPIAAGVVGLVLSINPLLSATDVRLILEHTCDKISPEDAQYDPITNRSLRYGYGRINADRAVKAAEESLTNGERTWPRRVANPNVQPGQLRWQQNGDPLEVEEEDTADDAPSPVTFPKTTNEFLVVQSDQPFGFLPQDGVCYSSSQLGCGGASIASLPDGVTILAVGCGLTCGSGVAGSCEIGAEQCVEFLQPAGTKYFGIYARSNIGRYSFGVSVDSEGNIVDPGQLPAGVSAPGGGGTPGGGGQTDVAPRVTISATPLEGTSPLTVRFKGNASSTFAIDESRTAWDFNIDDDVSVDATTRDASYDYVVDTGTTQTFIARLTMYDVEGNVGFAQISIHVSGSSSAGSGSSSSGDLRIISKVQGGVDEVDEGRSPFEVVFSLEADEISGSVLLVSWDLGDGTLRTGRQVVHTYVNETDADLRLIVTVTVTVQTAGGVTRTLSSSKSITVTPGTGIEPTPAPDLPGTGVSGGGSSPSACGVFGFLPLFGLFLGMMSLRRRRL